MNKNRSEYNRSYLDKKKKEGYKVCIYLLHKSITEDVKQYINQKKKELIKQYEKEN